MEHHDPEQPSFLAERSLRRELLEQLRSHQEEGRSVRPEELLPRWPVDPKTDADVASLLFDDSRQREERGDEPSVEDYEERFPEHKDSLRDLFRQNAVLRSMGGMSGSGGALLGLPLVGDDVFGFRLRHELGRGAFARVFLAEQGDLAGRPVVLKVSGIDGNEPQTLAQLQHTHIVPIYSVHENPKAGLRVVCMPYFGGASLSEVLQSLWAETDRPSRGEQIVQALALTSGPATLDACPMSTIPGHEVPMPQSAPINRAVPRPSGGRGSLPELERLDYVHASVWVVARLAAALQHAHQRGVLHRDIKPSNILLSSDGEPMLLDFNLAHNVNSAEAQTTATLGGTIAYMAPEHLRALASRDLAQARQVDRRADIYSLGMVLYEMLTGHRPFDQSASYAPVPALIEAMAVERARTTPSLRSARADVPWSLESIARKCLAPEPGKRYQHADQLAEDLTCFLGDLPLKHAPELSWVERGRKWGRRHPRLTTSGLVTAAASLLLTTAGAALIGANKNLASTQASLFTTREHLESARSRQQKEQYEADTVRALCLVNTTSDTQDHLARGLAVCEQALAHYDVLEHADWQERPDWQRLDTADRQRLAEDTRELLLTLAWGRVHGAPANPVVLHEALELLDRAEAIRGLPPSRALYEDRAHYCQELGDAAGTRAAREQADRLEPATARDHYQLALSHARSGSPQGFARAIAELDEAVRLNPHHYWSWMQRGFCYQEQHRYDLAASDFGVCIGLWPEFAWGHFNRGYVLYQSGHKAEAIACYDAALERDPDLVVAYRNRGLAHLELKEYALALTDITRACQLGPADASQQASLGMALEGLGRHSEADAAFALAFGQAQDLPAEARQRILLGCGFALAERRPDRARQAFDQVLRQQANQPQALYGRALLAIVQAEQIKGLPGRGQSLVALLCQEAGIRFFTEAIQADAGFVEARRFRAVVLARRGRMDAATEDINWCLEREPHAGATLYAAACVLALEAGRAHPLSARLAADQALQFLRRAFAENYGRDRAAGDADLAGLLPYAEFRDLLGQ